MFKVSAIIFIIIIKPSQSFKLSIKSDFAKILFKD